MGNREDSIYTSPISTEALAASAYLKLIALTAGEDAGLRELAERRRTQSGFDEDREFSAFIARSLTGEDLTRLDKMLPKTEKGLRLYLREHLSSWETRRSRDTLSPILQKLALEVLKPGPGESFYDFCGGLGSTVIAASQYAGGIFSRCVCFDPDPDLVQMTRIRADVCGTSVEAIALRREESLQIDQAVSKVVLPFPERLLNLGRGTRAGRGSVWTRCLQVLDHLEPDGKVTCFVPRSSTNARSDKDDRAELVMRGNIASVVALPKSASGEISAPVMVVMDGKPHNNIIMVDATHEKEWDRAWELEEPSADIAPILNCLEGHLIEGISAAVPIDTILSEDAVLDPKRHLVPDVQIVDGEELQNLAHIGRGTKGVRQDAKCGPGETSRFRFLEVKSISDGEIDYETMPYLSETHADEWPSRYWAEEGDIVVSKIGPILKAAIVEPRGSDIIVVSSNLYIVRSIERYVNPYYLRAFFDSPLAWQQLERCLTGSARIQMIPIGAIKNLRVPYKQLPEQAEIAMRYKKNRSEVQRLLGEIDAKRKAMQSLFNEDEKR